ncbi:MAG: pseudouridine synthase [Pseudomonadota bacterium]
MTDSKHKRRRPARNPRANQRQHSNKTSPSELILLNKPFRVMSQFSPSADKVTLASYIERKGFYPAGRLDYDSEGLLLLTNDGRLQHVISNPKFHSEKTYWVQVEGTVNDDALNALRNGVQLKDGMTRPAKVRLIDEPDNVWPRTPPIRERQSIPTQWIKLTITEGKNRQVRRMTAAVGHPTLRLIRYSIGKWNIDDLAPGEQRLITVT